MKRGAPRDENKNRNDNLKSYADVARGRGLQIRLPANFAPSPPFAALESPIEGARPVAPRTPARPINNVRFNLLNIRERERRNKYYGAVGKSRAATRRSINI
ncbi:hypothetical protein EVAR_26593_1 [Eumeta japonica]|uniref:Uncharacterized protein n=1 Tax=Eumeta variegata TaxID=151549 RepID=A0A4C1W490_EUMVA|nr:hypothetical protein EVAR_26593_1 [Eumeta japonica]